MTAQLRTVAAAAATLLLAAGIAHAQGDAKRGQKLFEECHACHSLERGAQGVGPGLHGVFGRRAGEVDDFRYSPALKRSAANRMPYAGMPEARDRADLIMYMQEVFK